MSFSFSSNFPLIFVYFLAFDHCCFLFCVILHFSTFYSNNLSLTCAVLFVFFNMFACLIIVTFCFLLFCVILRFSTLYFNNLSLIFGVFFVLFFEFLTSLLTVTFFLPLQKYSSSDHAILPKMGIYALPPFREQCRKPVGEIRLTFCRSAFFVVLNCSGHLNQRGNELFG